MYFNTKLSAMATAWSNRHNAKDPEADTSALIVESLSPTGNGHGPTSYGTVGEADTPPGNGHVKAAESNFSELSDEGTPATTRIDEESLREFEGMSYFYI